jgi:GTP cyclohydrolase I
MNTSNLNIEDIQGRADSRHIAIDKVGIKDILHPVRVKDHSVGEQHTIARFDLFVNLPHHFKGTHMSRFVEILNSHDREISIASFETILAEMVEKLEAESGYIEMRFPFFLEKSAPISGVRSLMDYQVTIIGAINRSKTEIRLRLVVPVTSLCPCSRDISDRGAHNQRSHVTVTVLIKELVWIEELIALVEAEASSPIYGLLKRADEKYVTENAYDHPKFVEDMVRDVASRLDADPRITTYTVESENFESIHNHSAYALIERNKAA